MATEEEPLSPGSRLFNSPEFNCSIIVTLGCKTRGNPNAIIDGLKNTLINHPRFSSKLEMNRGNGGKPTWVRTKVRVEDHVVVPDIDPDMEEPDKFLEDYISNLTTLPMDMSKPLWEIHLFNLKTSDAESVGVLKIHHSLGDGMSLMSLFLACTRKTSNPEALPTIASKKKRIGPSPSLNSIFRFFVRVWFMIRLIFNTFVDVYKFAATLFFLRDTETPIMSKPAAMAPNPRRCVHRIISFEDVKLVKNAMKMTINDVLLGVTQAGISRYLSRRYDQEGTPKSKKFMGRIRLHSAIMINLRPNTGIEALADMMAKGSKCRWGNLIGYVLLPFSVGLENDPLEYVRRAKSTIDRKKLSLEAVLSYAIFKFTINVLGFKAGEALVKRVFGNTTMTFSNLVGPKEEISFYGHPISYIASSAFGHPHSYADKIIIAMAVDPTVIPDPHRLCDDFSESFETIKSAVLERGLCNEEV
ncbi:PREDICTED: O-acyltransferase WSD1 isoform X2 [Tarenaya hassleriana]|uniref:O-acyltransferase WSD1 isoform X2 n=1 Tax=Tarenaya hassleriana TaxID=28532 RepID=UPI00053C7A30|nr:PREDICTED: O-acyltransferase WSD1 isoform X2 [Tarenaya hassleriana]